MKKEWKKPELEILDINQTYGGRGWGAGGNPNNPNTPNGRDSEEEIGIS